MEREQHHSGLCPECQAAHHASPAQDTEASLHASTGVVEIKDCTIPRPSWHSSYGSHSSILRELFSSQRFSDRGLTINAFIAAAGFDSVCSYRFRINGEGRFDSVCCMELGDCNWSRRYAQRRYMEIDPRVAHGCYRDIPFVWDIDTLHAACQDNPDERCAEMLDGLRVANMFSGITFGFTSENGPWRHVVIFNSARASGQWIADRIVGGAYAIGVVIHMLLTEHDETTHTEDALREAD